MGLRFRRSFKLAPGIRLNFSGSGLSASIGPRGLSATFGSRGTFLNTGIPGTGLYSRQRIDSSPSSRSTRTAPERVTKSATVKVEDDGTIKFLDEDGQPLSSEWIERAKRQKGDVIRNLIQTTCNDINANTEALGKIHLQTPGPHERLRYEPQEFTVASPAKPLPKLHGFLGWLFESRRNRIDDDNAQALADYEIALKEWQGSKRLFDVRERARKELLEERVFSDVGSMEDILEGALKNIVWPRETAVSAEIDEGGLLVLLDVDLPEIEDMPKTTASVPSRGYKLNVKEMSATKIQKLYMQHVHGIGFRIIGESFAVLPKVHTVVLSAFSQRANKVTGAVTDEYLYSVRVTRGDWTLINFANLGALDVTTALERFELRRDMSKSGIFRPVEPLTAQRS